MKAVAVASLLACLAFPHRSGAQEAATPAPVPAAPAPPVEVSFRHMVILNFDIKTIYGLYFFAAINNTDAPQPFTTQVMLPTETADFKPQDGLTDQDIQVASDGVVTIAKMVKPGLSLMGMGVEVKITSFGNDQLTFIPPTEIKELSLAVAHDVPVVLSSPGMVDGLPPMLANGQYKGIMNKTPLSAQKPVTITIEGLPKGRPSLWIVGAIFAMILAVACAVLAVRTLPRRHPEARGG